MGEIEEKVGYRRSEMKNIITLIKDKKNITYKIKILAMGIEKEPVFLMLDNWQFMHVNILNN